MLGLADILGQPRVITALRSHVQSGRLHHAHLFEGPEGVGKRTAALALARAVNCRENREGCGTCDACVKIAAGNHPDVIAFDMTQKGLTERVRELLTQLSFAPHEGNARIIIFDPAENLAGPQADSPAQAANALLKTLEEPPARTHFILLSAQPRRLPVTVRSRVEVSRFAPLETATIVQLLVKDGVDATVAAKIADEAEGSMAIATTLREAEGPTSFAQAVLLAEAAATGSVDRLLETCAEVAQGAERSDLALVCRALGRTVRDAIAVDYVALAPRPEVQRLVQCLSAGERHDLFRESERAMMLLAANVAPQLVLENLLMPLCLAAKSRSRA